jgi:hypothetical protein
MTHLSSRDLRALAFPPPVARVVLACVFGAAKAGMQRTPAHS